MAAITCGECGKTTGTGEVGQNWICEDCRVAPAEETRADGGVEAEKPDRDC